MTITTEQLIALLPLLITGLTVVVVMLSIAWRRNHFVNATLTVIGLNLALLSLWFVGHNGATDVTSLLRVDGYSVFYTALVLMAGLATCTFAFPWLKSFHDNTDEFYLLVAIAVLGGIVLASADHLASMFIGVELLSLPLFGLVGYAFRHKRSLEAAIKYTILSAAASSFLLFGIALVYAGSGDLSFAGLGQSLSGAGLSSPLMLAGFGMIVIGIGFKLSLVPFHLWTPDVYQGAPAPVSAFLATGSKIAIFAVMMRLFIDAPISHSEGMRTALGVIAFASILFGNLMAIAQTNIKRLLGYSSIAHLGYLLVALIASASQQLSLETTGVYLAGYLFSSLGAFGVVSLMSAAGRENDTDSLYSYRGLFWHRPVLSGVLAMMMLSLAGIPSTLGFIGKFYVLASAVNGKLWWLAAAVVAGSAIGLYYYLRVTVSLFLSAPGLHHRDTTNSWGYTAGGIVTLISAILVLLLGIFPQPLITLVKLAQPFM